MPSKSTVGILLLVAVSSFPVSAGENWQGGYVGVNAGGAFLNNSQNVGAINQFDLNGSASNQSVLIPATMKKNDAKSSIGIQAGYNLQFNRYVFGVEADVSSLNGSKTARSTTFYTEPVVERYSSINEGAFTSKYLLTLRPKIGYAWDNLMVYGTAGLATSNANAYSSFKGTDLGPGGGVGGTATYLGSKSVRKLGYSIGAGAEYALNNKVSIKADYLYYDLGSVRFKTSAQADALADGANAIALQTVKARMSGNLVRIGLNFKL
jgi:outer membrane immunogenic protein